MEILPKVRGVDIVHFGEEDVVRHDMVTRIVKAYNRRDAKLPTGSQDRKTKNSGEDTGQDRGQEQDEATARHDD